MLHSASGVILDANNRWLPCYDSVSLPVRHMTEAS